MTLGDIGPVLAAVKYLNESGYHPPGGVTHEELRLASALEVIEYGVALAFNSPTFLNGLPPAIRNAFLPSLQRAMESYRG